MGNPLMEAALTYAEAGMHVLPLHSIVRGRCTCGRHCGSPAKHPRTLRGLKDATTDRDTIIQWWTDYPDANVGIRTGKVSGLWVLDVDNKKSVDLGDGSLVGLGDHTLATMEGEVGYPLPVTLTSETGGGGRHILFGWPNGVDTFGNRANLAPGIDVRADEGYIVAPPSVHASGARYQWVDEDADIVEPPAWLLNLAPRPEESTPFESVEQVAEGGRNDYLFRYGSKLRGEDRNHDEIRRLLIATNLEVCNPPLEYDEVLRIVTSVMRYQPNPKEPEIVWDTVEADVPEMGDGDLVFRTVADLLLNPPEPKRPIIGEGLLDEGDGAVIVGQSGIGKSWLALDLSMAVSMGYDWLGRFEVQQGPVVYIDEEGSEWDMFKRQRQIATSRGVDFASITNLKYSVAEEIKLDDDRGITQIRRIIGDMDPVLIVFDALVRMHSGDENSNRDMARFFSIVKKLKKHHRAAFLFLHHIRKPGKDDPEDELDLMRGAGDIRAWPDTIWTVREKDRMIARVRHAKSRGHKMADPFYVHIDADENEVKADLRIVDIHDRPTSTTSTRDMIFETIAEAKVAVVSAEYLAGVLQLTTKTVREHLDVMEEEGTIRSFRSGKTRSYTTMQPTHAQQWLGETT
jgi:hypothetical protein